MHYSVNTLGELDNLIANEGDTCYVTDHDMTFIMTNGEWVEKQPVNNTTLNLLNRLKEQIDQVPENTFLNKDTLRNRLDKMIEEARENDSNSSLKWLDKLTKR